ncbi:MAG: hypothetical protein JO187_00075 [Acidobacteria bacterium]|nr:hypothetical protein [Acidobacteriaceae bacterium]MBV9607923.1 hypothetical protein [Acidobacteriota bacterium]
MRRSAFKVAIAAVFVAMSVLAVGASDAATLKFTVLKAENQKPVRNAAVILHPVDNEGRQRKGGLEVKTDGEGNAKIDGIPFGKLRIQVIAPGLQTYGQDYDIKQAEQEFVIKMNRPKEQLSIYK